MTDDVDWMMKRYVTIDEMLTLAKVGRMVVRSNSLAGVFIWTPDEFIAERAAKKFPARCNVCNFWLEPVEDYLEDLARKKSNKLADLDELKRERTKFERYAEATRITDNKVLD